MERRGEERAKKVARARKSGSGARKDSETGRVFRRILGPFKRAHATQRASLRPGVARSIRFRRSKRCN